ncbi:MAG: hypothetical protein HFJ11_00120 [Bacilli bacterium]|nr:hypothetical protein [Bacilli bacterium]
MSSKNCIGNLLKLICLLQDNSTSSCNLENGCSKPYLGPSSNSICYNTRIIQLYRCNGTLMETTYTSDNGTILSTNFYRVMSVDNNCCTLLLINYDNLGDTYNSTRQYITVDLACIGAVRCIRDVTVNCL